MNKKISYKRAAIFIASQNLSLFGTDVVSYAVTWSVTLQTSSGLWLGLFSLSSIVPSLIATLIGGALADRHNKKHLIMLTDGFSGLCSLLIALLWLFGLKSLPVLLILNSFRAFANGIQSPAVTSLFPQLVPQEKLTRVSGINQTLQYTGKFVSPALGGIILSSFGLQICMLVDILTASLAIITMSFIKIKSVIEKSSTPVISDLIDGFKYTFKRRDLRKLIVFFSIFMFLIAPVFSLTPLYITREFGEDVWRLTIHEIVFTAGMVAGGIFVSVKSKFANRFLTLSICAALQGMCFSLFAITSNFSAFLIFLGIGGIFWPIVNTIITVYVQENVPEEHLGRVSSLLMFLGVGVFAVTVAVAAPLADVISLKAMIIVFGIASVPVGGAFYTLMKRESVHTKSCKPSKVMI